MDDQPIPGVTPMDALGIRADVAVRGMRTVAPVHRTGGAGPSDDGHVMYDGRQTAIPINPTSPYRVREGTLHLGDTDLGVEVAPIRRPRFYDLCTEEGIPYEQLARLHGRDVLATTVVQTCMRYEESQRCRFCAIEESLRTGSTVAVKRPRDLAEVAEAAVRLDGVTQMVMTTGTARGRDRGATHLARCVRAVLGRVPGLPIQVQCEPPTDLTALSMLHEAGAKAIGIHVESMDDGVRRRWTPGKATVPLDSYRATWREAVRVFGWNHVSTYLLIGLGEDPDHVVSSAEELIAMGVYPFVVPYRPLAGTLANDVDHAPAPGYEEVAYITAGVADALRRAGMSGEEQGAGCAACGACSALGMAADRRPGASDDRPATPGRAFIPLATVGSLSCR